MTDLRRAAEMALEALEWSFGGEPMPSRELEAINAIRQALDEWTPDDTAYRPDGLSMPVDRGAWSDVENATKWVDELRGDEPDTDTKHIGEIVEAHGLIAISIPKMPPVGTKLYAQPLLNQTCCECGRSGGFALYCGWCWDKGN